MYKPVGWEDVARSPNRRRSAEKPARRDVPAAETAAASRESSEAEESTEEQSTETKDTGVNAVRLLSGLLSQPANRICAECRTHLADTSRIYASFSTVDAEDNADMQQRGSSTGIGTSADTNITSNGATVTAKDALGI